MSSNLAGAVTLKDKVLDALREAGLPLNEPGVQVLEDDNGTRIVASVTTEKNSRAGAALRSIYNVVIYTELNTNKYLIPKALHKPEFFSYEKNKSTLRRPAWLNQQEEEPAIPTDPDVPKHPELIMAAADKVAADNGTVPASPTVRELVDYWKSLGLKIGKWRKGYEAAVHAVRDLLHGKKFVGTRFEKQNRKFRTDEIKVAMDNFAKAALNDAYLPARGTKRRIRGYTLPQFAYNPFVRRPDQTKGDSQLLRYLQGPPQPANRMEIPDEYPTGTAQLKKLYEQHALGGMQPRYNAAQEQALRFAIAKGMDFFQRNRSRVALPQAVFGPGGASPGLVAGLLWDAMVRGGEPSRVRLVWFRNPIFYEHDFVSYLCGQGVLEMELHKRREDD